MTDVISGKNRKRHAGLKVVLPIFTQHVSAVGGYFFCENHFPQDEQRIANFIQINLL